MPKLTYKQKEEKAIDYLRKRNISFGNRMADDCAIEIFIAGIELNEEKYEFTIAEFKDAYSILLKNTWDEQYKYLSGKIKEETL